ncbi:MAG: PAS domain S-box protein [Desulfomonilaceae bacterium]
MEKLRADVPLRITFIYLFFGALYVVITEPLTTLLIISREAILILELFKEASFVVTSALLIYYLLRREMGRRLGAEVALAKSEKKFRELYETMRDGIAAVSMEGKIIEFNPSYQAMLGYTREELLEKTVQELTPKKWHPMQAAILKEQLLTKGYSDLYEKEYVRRDGTVFPAELRTYLIRDDQGRPAGLWAIVRDISVRKQAQEGLREQTERFQILSENVPFGMAMFGEDGTFKYVNPKFEKIFGYDLKEAPNVGEWCRNACPDHAQRQEAISAWKEDFRRLDRGETGSIVFTVTCKDGSQKIISFKPVKLGARENLMTCEDITDRKRAEAALEESETRYRTLAETARDIIWTVDLDLKYTYVSPSITEALGYTVEEIIGTKSMDRLTPASRERVTKAFIEEMGKEMTSPRARFVSRTEEMEVYHKDGSTRWKEVTTTFLRDQNDRPNGILGISRDITDRKRMESELKEARENLERRVEERTAELSAANEHLREQIDARIRAEQSLRTSEERLRAIVETATDYIFIKDQSLKYVFVNPAFADLLGDPTEIILGKTDEELFAPETGDHTRDLETRVLRGETVEEEHTRRVHGSLMTFLAIRAPMYDHQGNIIGLCGISRNITERVEVREGHAPKVGAYVSEATRSTLVTARLAAAADSIVLLTGESGAGKDYLARYIHDNSKRSSGPFYSVNCGAIPSELAESELFGHEAGAFTGAAGRKRGLLELAEGGTILLNEIGELLPALQVKLLMFLDTWSFTRVGGEKNITVDARLIVATNKDLMKEVAESRFRKDLFYRLQVFPLQVPPLRDRKEDIPILVKEIIGDLGSQMPFHRNGSVNAPALNKLINYAWPGNVRELRNVLERALILSKGRTIRAHHLALQDLSMAKAISTNFPTAESFHDAVRETKRSLIVHALSHSQGSITKAATILRLSRDSLNHLIKTLGIRAQ